LWVLPYAYVLPNMTPFQYVWLLALLLVFISSGWAAGDVSLSAFIQASLTVSKKKGKVFDAIPLFCCGLLIVSFQVSPLSAVMSFLYATYIIVYALMSFGLGRVFDSFNAAGAPREGLFWLAGVQMSIACVVVFASSFIPKGSAKFNPSYEDLGVKEAAEEALAVDQEEFQDLVQEGNYFEILT